MPNDTLSRIAVRAVTQWTPGIKPTWTVSEVRTALRQHAEGDFSNSAQLVDTMGEDDALPGLLEKRVGGVLSSDFSLEPVEAPNRQLSKRLVDKYGPAWWDFFPESELTELLGWRRMLGVGIGVLDWDRGGSEWKARLRTLHPQFLRYDSFRRKWLYQAQEGELEVTPGDGTWILLADGQRSWMRCAVRALAVAWIAKQHTIRDWNRYNERHGLPIVKAMAPAIADDDDQDQFFEDVQNLNSEIVALLPTHLDEKGAGFDLDLLEAKDQSWASFEKQLDRCDRRFTIHMLGANMGTEVNKEGARATSDTHRGVEREKAKVDATNLSTELRRQGLYPLVGFNYPGVTIDVVPWPKWDTEPPADDDAEAKSKESFGRAIKEIGAAGYEVENIDKLGERYGLKLKKKEPVAPPALPAGTTGVPAVPAATPPPAPLPEGRGDFMRLLGLASGDNASGFIDGQLYSDAVVEHLARVAREDIDETLEAVREELEAATGYDDLRDRLRSRYKDMSPERLNQRIELASLMANLAGRAAVNQDA